MTSKFRFDRDTLDPEVKGLTTWPTVKTDEWDDAKRERFERFESAIRAYFAGGQVKEICSEFQVPRQEFHRRLQQCLAEHSDGRIYGWRGLIPYARRKPYDRTKPVKAHPASKTGGDAGAFSQLLDRYPDLEKGIQSRFYKEVGGETVHEPRIPLMAILKWFLDACKRNGFTAKDYPFCTQSLGRTALWRYLKRLVELEPQKAADAIYGKHAARRWRRTGHGPSTEKATRPFERIQCDGHRIDMRCTILVPHTHGGFVRLVLQRLWLLLIIDVFTRAVLGYHISLNHEYNAEDVLICVKNAITPWKPRTLTIPGFQYAKGAGLPSGIRELEWVLFDEFCYDNAKANLAKRVLNKIASVVGCAINPGPVETPESRAIIERFFETLEEASYHRSPSTTGSGPTDPRRNSPEKAAEGFEILLDHQFEITDLVIAKYNATPHSGIGYKSPLDLMQQFADDENSLMRTLPEDQRSKLGLLDVEFTRQIRGNVAEGRRPYINLEGARYRSDVLARSPELIKKKLKLIMDPDDARSVTAYLPNGAEFGVLTANGFWGIRPHTLEIRKAILSLKRERLIYFLENQDPMPVYLEYLAKAKKSKATARAQAKAQMYAQARPSAATSNNSATTVASEDESAEDEEAEEKVPVKKTFTY
jgi:transposase InsO family protein